MTSRPARRTPQGEVDIAAVKVYFAGRWSSCTLSLRTPGELLARPDQVLAPAPEHDEYAMTLRTRSSGARGGIARPLDLAAEHHQHYWDLTFRCPARPGRTPHHAWCGPTLTSTYLSI